MIEIKNITKSFGQNHILRGVTFSMCEGQITTIIGKSGIGKSVLLKHIIGLIKPDTGCITFKGQDINKISLSDRKKINKKFSYMFQEAALFDSMTAHDNIALPIQEKNVFTDREIEYKVQKHIHMLDLSEIKNKYPAELSGGMKKRVAMARALITEPEIVLFDEPTAGLDPIRKKATLRMIEEHQKQLKFSSIIVSHDIPEIFYISDKVVMMSEGKVIFEGTTIDIQNNDNFTIKEFISGEPQP